MIPLSQPQIGSEESEAVLQVLQSGMLAQGPEVAAFESEFSEVVDDALCVAVNSGTSALHLGLLAAGVGPGDEVIVPSFTFAATANAVALAGATPVFADIELETFNLSPDAVVAAITARTAAVMPVHLYGQAADMTRFEEVASRHGLLLVEDAAQAHLAEWNGRRLGTYGLAMFSFYPTKNMTSGEGGMITTSDEAVARRARLLRNQGMEKRYANEIVGFNCRMTDLHAAIGRVQLARLPERTKRRQQIAERYSAELTTVTPPFVRSEATHVYHQYTIRTDRRDDLIAALERCEIGYGVYYPTPVHRLPSFDLRLDLPNTEAAARTALSIPVHPALSDAQVDEVVRAVNQWH